MAYYWSFVLFDFIYRHIGKRDSFICYVAILQHVWVVSQGQDTLSKVPAKLVHTEMVTYRLTEKLTPSLSNLF